MESPSELSLPFSKNYDDSYQNPDSRHHQITSHDSSHTDVGKHPGNDWYRKRGDTAEEVEDTSNHAAMRWVKLHEDRQAGLHDSTGRAEAECK